MEVEMNSLVMEAVIGMLIVIGSGLLVFAPVWFSQRDER
jgi:hypothetical protein